MNFSKLPAIENPKYVEMAISPEEPHMPMVLVREDKENGTCSAIFELSLSGARSQERFDRSKGIKGGMRVPGWDRYIHSLIDGMSNDQELQIIHKAGIRPDGATFLDWTMRGISRAETKKAAMHEAIRLYQGINIVMGTAEEMYRLSPVTNTEGMIESSVGNGWKACIEPTPVLLTCEGGTPLGFMADKNPDATISQVVLPMYARRRIIRHFDAIASGAKTCLAPVTCMISISPVQLSRDELKKARETYKALLQGRVEITRAGLRVDQGFEEKAFLAGLSDRLHGWIENRRGFRAACVVMSDAPVPMTLLTMIGGEVFHGSPVTVRTFEEKFESHSQGNAGNLMIRKEEDVVDLRACFTDPSALPPLFPKTSALTACGVERFYAEPTMPIPGGGGILLGYAGHNGYKRDVRFPQGDRSRHCYLVGASGTGKSTLLYNKIVQDIRNGQGVAVIDPHGELHSQVLHSIPRSRLNDVVLVDPCDFEYAVGINFLECSNSPFRAAEMNYVVNEMIKIFDRLYDLRQTGGPIFEQYMRNALLLLMESEELTATLIDIPRIFEDRSFRRFLLKTCRNPLVVNFWEKQAETAGGDAALNNIGPYITSKLNQFTTNAILRPIIGQPKSTIDFTEALDKGKILLVNLSKGLLGELDTQLLGMLVIGKLFSCAMARVTMEKTKRRSMFLYVDEFQNFTTDSVAYLISEARKFGLNLILANQNLSQLSVNPGKHNILDSVLGNVGSIFLFRLGAVDSAKLEVYTRPQLWADDLQELPDFHVAARMLMDNTPQKPFVFKTLPMSVDQDTCDVESVITASRARYAVETRIVEEEIRKRLETGPGDSENS